MADDTYYITPHEAALAVVATSMKKARLRLDTLVINSIIGGILFSAGGMLHLCAQAENPDLWSLNPGIIHFQQGMVYPIGLFYVIMMGAELYNSNILYFSVGVCRGAVTILDLLVSWSVSWLFNLGANLFVCYVICNLSGVTQADHYIKGSIQIVDDKMSSSFIETFLKGCAGNFCVCLAVYLQLLAKPIHVKLIVMSLPIFTFVSMGFTHTVADMFLVPMGLINGAPHSVGAWIWKGLIPATLGNAVGGSAFGIVIPWYLHLVVVERDRKTLNLPTYVAQDEQPELEMDSRVVRVKSQPPPDSVEKSSGDDSEDSDDLRARAEYNPVSYRPVDGGALSRSQTTFSRLTATSTRSSRTSPSRLRSPPGVFPVMGMGKPLTREATIAGSLDPELSSEEDNQSIDSYSIAERPVGDGSSLRSRTKQTQREEEEDYVKSGGYNARENKISETLKKVISNRRSPKDNDNDIELGFASQALPTYSSNIDKSARRESVGSKLLRTFTSMTQRQPGTAEGISDHLSRHKITPRAASAADNIAGIDGYTADDLISCPGPIRRASQLSQVSMGDDRGHSTQPTPAQLQTLHSVAGESDINPGS